MDDYKESYSLTFQRQDRGCFTNINVNFESDYLPEVLAKMRDFLTAAGFTYVDKLVAVTEDGSEHISDED